MKFFIVIALLSVSSLSFANHHKKGYGSSGCGLGSMLIEGDNTWWKQVLAATTNGISGNQTFGISSGTLNCDSPTPGKMAQIEAYIEANKMALANDIAKGDGETVSGLSKVYGCENNAAFGQALKSNYRTIFPSYDVTTNSMASEINSIASNVCNTQL